MRLRLDEQLPVELASEFAGHDVQTVTGIDWQGLTNGEVLRQAPAQFEALVTMDRDLEFQANRRLLDVQRLSHDCAIGEAAFARVQHPQRVQGQRVPALRFADPRGPAVLQALLVCHPRLGAFSQPELRQTLAALLGVAPRTLTPGRMTYDLRRLRLHGLIERSPNSHRYRLTRSGLRLALFFTRTDARILRPGLAVVRSPLPPTDSPLRGAFDRLEQAMTDWCAQAKLAA